MDRKCVIWWGGDGGRFEVGGCCDENPRAFDNVRCDATASGLLWRLRTAAATCRRYIVQVSFHVVEGIGCDKIRAPSRLQVATTAPRT